VRQLEFDRVFKSGTPARDKFLSRLFGIFNEEAVRIWARCPRAPYEDLGRPTLRRQTGERGSTLDFTLRSRANGLSFIAEMKCELEYERYRYLRLLDAHQLLHHRRKLAFELFLEESANPGSVSVQVGGNRIENAGGILIWGSTSESGVSSTIERHGFRDVLSLERIIRDLQAWNAEEWSSRVAELHAWSQDLFDALSESRSKRRRGSES